MSKEKGSTAEWAEESRRDWHRLLAAILRDYLTGQPVTVEPEFDLSLQQQFLDILLLRKSDEPMTVELPDGFEELAKHNLVSFKSHHETLDGEALDELVGAYVAYRKFVTVRNEPVPPPDQFRLFVLTIRTPEEMMKRVALREIRPGVFEVNAISGKEIRIVVVRRLPPESRNALPHLFSALPAPLTFAKQAYRVQSSQGSTLLRQLLGRYQVEGIDVPFDLDKYCAELEAKFLKEDLEKLAPEQRLVGLSPDDILKALSPEAREALRRQLLAEAPPEAK